MRHKYSDRIKPHFDQLQNSVQQFIEWSSPHARKVKNEWEQVGEHIHPVAKTDESIRRMAAFALDLLISFLLWLFPIGGWVLSVGYMLLRDSLPFLAGKSAGKRFFHLRVAQRGNLKPITGRYLLSAKRNLTILVPGLNLYDIYSYFIHGDRLGDQWAVTLVIDERYDMSSKTGTLT
ncbi:MAG: hypothetical protein JXR39_05545 [Marinilabiliaceae bacterium]|nr:hypothetical protein [Marinilabiliaceae bacterium]